LVRDEREEDLEGEAVEELDADVGVADEVRLDRRAAEARHLLGGAVVLEVVLDPERVVVEAQRELTEEPLALVHLGTPDGDAVVWRTADLQPIEGERLVLGGREVGRREQRQAHGRGGPEAAARSPAASRTFDNGGLS